LPQNFAEFATYFAGFDATDKKIFAKIIPCSIFLDKYEGGIGVGISESEAKAMLDTLEKTAEAEKKRGVSPGQWEPLQNALEGDESVVHILNIFPHPIGIFDYRGILEFGNLKLLEATGYTAEDVAKGRANLNNSKSAEFTDGIKKSLHGETITVEAMKDALRGIAKRGANKNKPADTPEYRSAVLFPFPAFDKTIIRGAVMFYPYEYPIVFPVKR